MARKPNNLPRSREAEACHAFCRTHQTERLWAIRQNHNERDNSLTTQLKELLALAKPYELKKFVVAGVSNHRTAALILALTLQDQRIQLIHRFSN
ncbi:hypothetical protein [Prochlorococcus sp. MIT 0707]|uniref:hypothetical protein n=1 Tax=Prochlorococcus sp. MIT 0707 TaxID=3082860 RepID=UPI0039A4C7E7